MKRLVLPAVLLFPLATLLFWIWLGWHHHTALPSAAPLGAPTANTNLPDAK